MGLVGGKVKILKLDYKITGRYLVIEYTIQTPLGVISDIAYITITPDITRGWEVVDTGWVEPPQLPDLPRKRDSAPRTTIASSAPTRAAAVEASDGGSFRKENDWLFEVEDEEDEDEGEEGGREEDEGTGKGGDDKTEAEVEVEGEDEEEWERNLTRYDLDDEEFDDEKDLDDYFYDL